jgi:hypothetical protein
LKELLLAQDPTIYEQTVDASTILVSRKSCSYIANIYGELQFTLQNT